MGLIRLFTPDGVHGDALELESGEAIIVGRAPDPEAPPVRALLGEHTRVDRLALASPSVSANHAIVESVDERIVVTDLGSRNGTWVRLPQRRRVELEAVGEIQVRVGGQALSVGRDDEEHFPAIQWRSADEFASAIAQLSRRWLAQSLHSAEVRVVDAGDRPLGPGSVRFPLPAGRALDVRVHETVDADWPNRFAKLWAYVERQASLFEAEASARADGMILASDGIRLAHRQVIDAAGKGQRLLILGPSGSGKELLARAYHRHSNRSGPFVAINCAELDTRVRAELFGTEPGAYTDAVKRAGAIEAANGGTLFLDEVGELSKEVQAILLRFLDRGEFARTGELARTRKADVRIVCATNRDLRDDVRKERFRLDLWFRLASHVVEVPALHLRLDDLEAYLRARKHEGAESTWAALSPEAIEVVRQHRWDGPWGGNFRELQNFASRLPDASGPASIDEAMCRRAIQSGAISPSARAAGTRVPALPSSDWSELASAAAALAATTYAEDNASGPPDWNAVKDYIENHLKPVLFARLAGVDGEMTLETARSQSSRLGVDRATRIKQLERYFERFVSNADKGR